MAIGQFREKVPQVGIGFDAIHLAGADQAGEAGPVFSALIMAREQSVAAVHGRAADRVFHQVGVDVDVAGLDRSVSLRFGDLMIFFVEVLDGSPLRPSYSARANWGKHAMQRSVQLVDSHVHLYSQADLDRVAGGLPYALPAPHPLQVYLDLLIDAGFKPDLVNNVHLSILPDSENVFSSFAEMDALKARNPAKYGGVTLVGTILAAPAYATMERLAHPQVKGIRIVLHDARPEAVSESAYTTEDWAEMFARLRPDQHCHVYAQDPEVTFKVLRQIPTHVPVIIDHLGTCQPERGADAAIYAELLEGAASRGKVWFKGPGYRTSTDPSRAADYATRIVQVLGADKLILEASDAPHVGTDQTGRAYADLFTPKSAFSFTFDLASQVAARTGTSSQALLNGACGTIFNPHQ